MKYTLVFLLVISFCGFLSCTKKSDPNSCKKSTEIPEKREYPVNAAIPPCENFYQYACSRAISCFELREDRSRHLFAINDASERLLQKKKDFLRSLGGRRQLSKRAQGLRNFFVACMDNSAREGEERRYVKIVSDEVASQKDRAQFLSWASTKVVSPYYSFAGLGRRANLDNADYYDLLLDPGVIMTLPEPSYYEKNELIADFRALVTEFFKAIGKEGSAKSLADSVVNMEIAFSKTYPRPAEQRKLYTKRSYISRAKFVNSYPQLRLNGVLKEIPGRTKIRYLFPKSYKFLDTLLAKHNLEDLKAFYLWHELNGTLDDAYPEFYKKRFDFYHKHLGGPAKRPERGERCTRTVMRKFYKELDAELIDELFPNFPVDKFRALVEKVRGAMVERLEKNRWLSKKGRNGALVKMQSTSMQLVKPLNEVEWDFLPEANYDPKTPIANSIARSKVWLDKVLTEFRTKRNRKRWHMGPLTVNAYYSPPENRFVMLQGILQFPFYEPQAPDYVNLGGAGMVIGHELGHAIDDQGAKFDKDGKLRQWMTKKDLANFKALSKKLIKQYEEMGHNGELTLGENIADVTGLAFAYDAAFPKNEGTQEAKQAFFLQYARLWCGIMRPAEYERRIKVDPHAQTEVRVNEPLKHQDGFYEAYGCKVGDRMFKPEAERAKIW